MSSVIEMICVVAFLLSVPFCVAIESISELQFDDNHRLANNVLLHSNSAECAEKVKAAWRVGNSYTDARQVEGMVQSLAEQFTGNETESDCVAVCLQRGTAQELVTFPLPQYLYRGGNDLNKVIGACRAAEIGIISYDPRTNLKLYWVNKMTGEVVYLDTLEMGERKMKWHSSYLGHQFQIRQEDDIIKAFTVEFDGLIVQGDPGHGLLPAPVPEKNIENAMRNEWSRCNRVKRTFTELGFSRGRLPNDIWASISAYNYNNRNNAAREEWDSKGYFVNWWDVTPYLLGMPWKLKRVWQDRLKGMVEAWIGGIPLENTDIYGIRRYEDGARLLTHVDREATHAASMIINVEQVDMREDWMVEIYDFAGRLHEIPMQPGDVVYYEVRGGSRGGGRNIIYIISHNITPSHVLLPCHSQPVVCMDA